jgi:Cu(I)/Ag(I) efflux system membrane fusion protein
VIDTGVRKVVYVETAPGVFEGREVVLGPRTGSRFPVLDGLSPGEKVAASGAFLIDAESRINPGAAPAEATPVIPDGEKQPTPGAGTGATPKTPPRTAGTAEPAHRH